MRSLFHTLTFIAFLVSFPMCSEAQSSLMDVVYLKNGSIIKGVIIEQIPGQAIKLQTADGSLFVFESEEILKMTREAASANAPSAIAPANKYVEKQRDEWGRTHQQNVEIADGSKVKGIAFLTTGSVLIAGGATLLAIGYSKQTVLSDNDFTNYMLVGYLASAASVPFFAIGGAMWTKHVKYRKRAEMMNDGTAFLYPVIISTEQYSGAVVNSGAAFGLQVRFHF